MKHKKIWLGTFISIIFLIMAACGSAAAPAAPTPLPPQVSPKDGMVMVYVPAGDFLMGSDNGDADEKPQHTVSLDAYWIDQTEVTNAMYA